MTIVSVRFQFGLKNKRLRQRLDRTYGAFEMWFESRLKPIKERLRGIEAKGVDIVSFWFHEDVTAAWRPNEWVRRMNTFEYDLELSRPCRHRFAPANQDPI
jgi:hypothetical protein